MKNLDVDKAIGFVNKLIKNVRCGTCDKLEGIRVRYQCGHIACLDCVIYAPNCPVCSPPSLQPDIQPKFDKPLTKTVKNAVGLLNVCHKFFDVNAFQRKRLSEQLRIEKELFPNCIQAPVKYENKRKSLLKANENNCSTAFPGEEIGVNVDMANTTNYVHQWLRKNESNLTRVPFSDLNVNTSWSNKSTNRNSKQNESITSSASRKRTHKKITDDKCTRKLSIKPVLAYDSSFKKAKNKNVLENKNNNVGILRKSENDESGIFMENEPIVIDDSQETVIDKDKNAWLSVLKACQNEDLESTSLVNRSSLHCTNDSNKQITINATEFEKTSVTRVPFFKRSAITETCNYCKSKVNCENPIPVQNPMKPVKITIDGDNFFTTITVFKNVKSAAKINTKNTVSVQTDLSDIIPRSETNDEISKQKSLPDKIVNSCDDFVDCDDEIKQSKDLLLDDKKLCTQNKEVVKGLVIEESDSDTDLDCSGPMSIKADVHRPCEDSLYGILSSVLTVKKHESTPRRRPRGHTPTSTDSSEKENYNPNRIKKRVIGKKKNNKK